MSALLQDMANMMPTILRDLEMGGFIAARDLAQEWIASLAAMDITPVKEPWQS